jgi:sugar/nucleoside kinase (ribokinase family)
MESTSMIRYLVAGQLQRDYVLTANGKAYIDIPGGNLLYTATGIGVWEQGIGLVSRIGEDYPHEWLDEISGKGIDTRGIRVIPDIMDIRSFFAYTDLDNRSTDNPVSHFSRVGLPFPKSLLGYTAPTFQIDSRIQPTEITIRPNDIPIDYLDATAAHLCPVDFISHSLIPPALRQGHISTLTIDPPIGYMNPTFWDNIPTILNGLTAFLTSDEKIKSLFQGKSTDLWEMAETLAGYGCEMIIIKRGARGQYVYDSANHSHWIIPAYPSRVLDPTGAGSAFCGGFLVGYRTTYNPLTAALYGNISASLVVEGSGAFYALEALPGLAQARLESLQGMVRKV